jgi:opacity protein-like surface antigen
MNNQKSNNKREKAVRVPIRCLRQSFVLFVLLVAAVIVQSPSIAPADSLPNYVVLKGGYYSPNQDYSVNDFNTAGARSDLESKKGFDAEIAFGHYLVPIFGLELGAGYFESKSSPAIEPGEMRLKVVPVQLSGKLFLPLGVFEPYGEFGIGAYFTKLEVSGNLGSFSGSSKITYGLHGGVGFNINFTDTFFLGLEGRYINAKPEYGGQPIKLDGYTATLNLGSRY